MKGTGDEIREADYIMTPGGGEEIGGSHPSKKESYKANCFKTFQHAVN